MLDTNAETVNPAVDWRAGVETGDVLMFCFPIAGDDGSPRVPRPCLALDVETVGDITFVLLAHGGPHDPRRARDLDVPVTATAERRAAGCRRPTAFHGDIRLLVSLANSGFIAQHGAASPVLGRLTGAARAQLAIVRNSIRIGTKLRRRGAPFQRGRTADGAVVIEYRLRVPLRPADDR